MKYLLLTLTLVFTLHLTAQTEIAIDSVSTYDSVKFKELLSYSKCPKDAMCIQTGEAKLILNIYIY